ncbi:hypothetical protein DLD99_10025 [Pseudomonas kribbensis]|uniref:Uncharacterized protein n=1 Tax=Pseudomonas kribbensis TaxID=1628086 RepID=A0A345RND1_9PSED|nr:hypothetical protein [Pseudomonas kribbensis]AXI60797.1 hypothetical protein DLD99_10025 [Pseudomonas kribbensis]
MNAPIQDASNQSTDSLETVKQQIREFMKSLFSEEKRKAYYAMSTITGLLIYFIYFSHINYTPRISLTDSVILLFSALIIGVGFSLVVAGLFILPSLAWKDLLEKDLPDEQPKRLKYIFINQGIALFFLINLALGAALYSEYRTYFIIALVATGLLWFLIIFSKGEKPLRNTIALLLNTFVMSICTLMVINIALHGVENIGDAEVKETTARMYVFFSLLIILAINVFFASFKKTGAIETTLSALGLLFVIFVATQSLATIPKGVMHILGLGSFRAEEIVMKNELCDYFKKLDEKQIKTITPQTCSLTNPWILWKGEDAALIMIKNIKYQIDKKDIKIISYKSFDFNSPSQNEKKKETEKEG